MPFIKKIIRWIMGWIETWRIMRNKELMASLKRAKEEMRKGRYYTLGDLTDFFGDKEKP